MARQTSDDRPELATESVADPVPESMNDRSDRSDSG